jgi:cytochrome c
MKSTLLATAASFMLAAVPAFAAGDVAQGEKDFGKCKACHSVINAAGEVIVKGGKVGPNLFGIVGSVVGGADPGYKYGDDILKLKAKGTVWTPEMLVAYSEDPTSWLKEATGDKGAKSKMTFKMKGPENVVAYLATFGAPGG